MCLCVNVPVAAMLQYLDQNLDKVEHVLGNKLCLETMLFKWDGEELFSFERPTLRLIEF